MITFRDDERYFKWLLKLINFNNYKNYKKLFHKLHNTSFYFLETNMVILRDDCREAEGLCLRDEFIQDNHTNISRIKGECSVLEMLIGLSRRMDDLCNGSVDSKINKFFILLLNNLNLLKYDDDNFNDKEVSNILKIFMDRKYDRFGKGSLFPIPNHNFDLRKLDIFGQMHHYINHFQL